ncbi:MAG: hypothetical protein Q9171_007188 [Xanthocarpia ochracea]
MEGTGSPSTFVDQQTLEMNVPEVMSEVKGNESDSDNESITSANSEDSVMEPFADYKPKIEQLVRDIGLPGFVIQELQHGDNFQNCVYALTSPTIPDEQYILRVPVSPDIQEEDGICQAVLNDVSLLAYLGNKLPVPRVKAYSATERNALSTPFTLQSRISGISLDEVYGDLDHDGKLAITDQFVDLLAQIESVEFPFAGNFAASCLMPDSTNDFDAAAAPHVTVFDEGDEDYVLDPQTFLDRAGADLKALLESQINGWIVKERKHTEKYQDGESLTLPYFEKMLTILDILESEGAFESSTPIVLYHWDLEPRNIMVRYDNGWKIVGIIDWDDVVAVPRSLARRAPDWLWDFESEGFTGYLNTDHHPKIDLSEESLAMKAYFDAKAKEVLGEAYLEDAYGTGPWLRRIWIFAKGGIHSTWYWDLVKLLVEDWEKREQATGMCEPVLAAEPSKVVVDLPSKSTLLSMIVGSFRYLEQKLRMQL